MTGGAPVDREIRVLLADDEPLARRGLELMLAADPAVRIVGQVGDGAAVVRAVTVQAPDLLLLDIEMPGMTGFDVLEAIPAQSLPFVDPKALALYGAFESGVYKALAAS